MKADDDSRFIFLCISLNAAYANECPDRAKFSECTGIADQLQDRTICLNKPD